MQLIQSIKKCKSVRVQPPVYAENVALPAFAAAVPAMQRLIDISYRPGSQQQTNCIMLQRANGRDGQTNEWTPYRFIDPALHIMRTVPESQEIIFTMETSSMGSSDVNNPWSPCCHVVGKI